MTRRQLRRLIHESISTNVPHYSLTILLEQDEDQSSGGLAGRMHSELQAKKDELDNMDNVQGSEVEEFKSALVNALTSLKTAAAAYDDWQIAKDQSQQGEKQASQTMSGQQGQNTGE